MMPASESKPTLLSWLVFSPSRDAQSGTVPQRRSGHSAAFIERLRALSPYAALLALPGGSLLALSLWLYRRQRAAFPFLAAKMAANRARFRATMPSARDDGGKR